MRIAGSLLQSTIASGLSHEIKSVNSEGGISTMQPYQVEIVGCADNKEARDLTSLFPSDFRVLVTLNLEP